MRMFLLSSRLGALFCVAAFLLSLGAARPAIGQGLEPRPPKKGRKYKVRIDSVPQQAAVYLDDEKYGIVGYTPWTGRIESGGWKIIVKKEGFEDASRAVTVRRTRRSQDFSLQMVKKALPGAIDVRGDADPKAFNAEVWVSGELRGKIPSSLAVPAGRYLVEVKKADFQPFSQWVTVQEGETVTLNPVLVSNKKEVGSLLIESDVAGAEVTLDGAPHPDKTPTLIAGIPSGPHVVEVKSGDAPAWRQTVIVETGKTVKVRAELAAKAAPKAGSVRVLASVPGAKVYLDGVAVGKAPITLSEIPIGEHIVEVRAKGYHPHKERLAVAGGSALIFDFELEPEPGAAVGGVRFLSNPPGAEILLDGELVGTTPRMEAAVPAGEHVVTLRRAGSLDYEETIQVAVGDTLVVNATLEDLDTGPTEAEIVREQRGLTSFGARTLARGRSTIDVGVGYPYYLQGAITVGAGEIANRFGFDAGVLFRSYFSKSELAVKARLTLFDRAPFSAGLFGAIGGGTTLFDSSDRLNFFADAGAAVSLTGLGAVTITGRGYFDFWIDRHCPGVEGGGFAADVDPVETCRAYLDGSLDAADRSRIDRILGGPDEIFGIDSGARFLTAFAVEIALRQHWNLWLLVEGAPFQGERAAYLDYFYAAMFDKDPGTYFRLGATYKF